MRSEQEVLVIFGEAEQAAAAQRAVGKPRPGGRRVAGGGRRALSRIAMGHVVKELSRTIRVLVRG